MSEHLLRWRTRFGETLRLGEIVRQTSGSRGADAVWRRYEERLAERDKSPPK